MKVLDLQCATGHVFEGWFASGQDFVYQCEKSMVACPVCGDTNIHKKLSAPRLNLLAHAAPSESQSQPTTPAASEESTALASVAQQKWMEMSRKILAHTDNVGTDFAEEARKIHYGEAEARAIRGQATPDEARALVDEGIDVLPLLLPESLKNPLQ